MRKRREKHLRGSMVEALQAGREAPEDVTLRALAHLVEDETGCPTCREVLRRYSLDAIAERAGTSYRDRVLHALNRAAVGAEDLRRERREADDLLDELARERDLGRAQALLLESPRFATLGLGMALLDQVTSLLDEAPDAARSLAVMAVCVAERLDPRRYPPTVVADLRGGAHGVLAAALCSVGDLDEAERELARAEEHRRQGSRQELYRAELELVGCRLLFARGRYDEVRSKTVRLRRWALRARFGGIAQSAIRLGAQAARAQGALERAALEMEVLAASMRGEVPWGEELPVRLELMAILCEAEQFLDAKAEADRIRLLRDGSESPVSTGRLALWSGVALRGLGELEEAEAALESAWRILGASGLGVEALRAALELLVLLAAERRGADLDALADELAELLTAESLPGWGAGVLLAALREIWMGETRSLEEARSLVDQILAVGAKRRPGELPMH